MIDGQGRVWITSTVRPPANPDFCKAGIEPSVGQGVSAGECRPAPRGLRSEDQAADAHQHLFQHAPPDVRRRRQQHAVDQRRRRRWRDRLAEHEDVRRDPGRGEIAGLVAVHPRHQRQRQARRLRRARPAGRSDQGQAAAIRSLRRLAGTRRIGLGHGARIPRRGRARGARPNPTETAITEYYELPWDDPKAPVNGFSPARRRRRSQRHLLVGARQRPHGELRSPQVQGAERTDRHRQPLSRGLDALSGAAAAAAKV